jgi:hypothetical protein
MEILDKVWQKINNRCNVLVNMSPTETENTGLSI